MKRAYKNLFQHERREDRARTAEKLTIKGPPFPSRRGDCVQDEDKLGTRPSTALETSHRCLADHARDLLV